MILGVKTTLVKVKTALEITIMSKLCVTLYNVEHTSLNERKY